ncbi:MAG: M14 family zinc carboxypeptidase [Bacteroidota bacterium]
MPASTNPLWSAASTAKQKVHNHFLNILYLKIFFLAILVVCLVPGQALSQSSQEIETIRKKLAQYPEVYISMQAERITPELVRNASLDYFQDEVALLYINAQAFEYLVAEEIPFALEKSPGDVDFDLNMLDVHQILDKNLIGNWDFYPTYEAYVALMYQFENDYPDLVKIHNIGQSVMGRDLLFAQIGPDVDTPRPVPQFMYTSTMHGDETTGFILSLRLIHHLISNYGVNDDITSLMNQVEIWICPNENPDGTYTNNNSTVQGATRSNANGKDLNRNYPGPHPDYPDPPIMPIQPETQLMMDFGAEHNFTMSANMHGGIELLNYPWDSWLSSQVVHADHEWWGFVSYQYVDTVHAYSPAGYMTGQNDGVTHGGDWYVVYGSRQDYFNYYHSCRELTMELSNQKLLSPTLLPAHWEYNYRSLINYIRQATYGFHGFVKDASTQQPVFATLELANHDNRNSHVVTSMPYGNFSRPVMAGTWDLVFSAEGYPDVVMENVSISNFEKLNLNIYMGEEVYPLYAYASDPQGGSVNGAGVYPPGFEVTLTAIPNDGYEFLYWENEQGHVISEQQEFSWVTSSGNNTLVAVFNEIPTHFAVHFDKGTGQGVVQASIDGNTISNGFMAEAGSDVLFEAMPATGYTIESWKVNGVVIPDYTMQEYLIEDLQQTINLVSNFTPEEYELNVSVNNANAGTVSVNPQADIFQYGQSVSLQANPLAGYNFRFWTDTLGNVVSEYETYSFSMPAHDLYLVAVFEPLSAITDLEITPLVKVYPNPAQENVSLKANFPISAVEVIDKNGQIVLTHHAGNNNYLVLPLNDLAPGMYLLKIKGTRGIEVVTKLQLL